ncbi:DUF6438 domain-containing protein [Flavobacterium sp. Arc3]|jgi:hypothetical protein|uniref:DUF6438 domain-containing protein n=1 Tax=Flavobacterium sp. Arc3 TaxID=3046686 RepID=UPI00352C0550
MKRQLFIMFILTLLISCAKKEKDFDSFEYSFGGTFSTLFSIKFTENDTIYLREHWNVSERYGKKFPKAKTNYYAILTKEQRNQLRELLKKIDFKKIKSEYNEDYVDGSAYQIIIKKDTFKKSVFVHSHKVPKELDSLSRWIYRTKEKLKLIETSKNFHFESINGILPPPPPPPPIKKIILNEK